MVKMLNTQLHLETKPVTQKERILRALKASGAQGVTNRQFIDMNIFRYSARIEELRKEGHIITISNIKGGLYRYTLETTQ